MISKTTARAVIVSTCISLCAAAMPGALAQSYVDFATLPDVPAFRWTPSHLTMSDDGSLFVATESDQVFAFDPQGNYTSSFDLPGGSSGITGFAVDAGGTLHVARESRIEGFDSAGALVYDAFGLGNIRGIAVGPDDRLYVANGPDLGVIEPGGGLNVLASNSFGGWNDIAFDPEGTLYAHANLSVANRTGPVVQSFNTSGAFLNEFPISKQNEEGGTGDFSGFAVSTDAVYVSHDRSGAVQKYAKAGGLEGVGYGAPRNSDLLVTPSGDLLAAAPHARIVETIGPERYAANYAGVTRLFDRPPLITQFGSSFFSGQQVDLEQGWTETTGETFLVPGAPGETVDLTFHRTGFNRSVISVYPVEAISVDPIEDPAEYLRQAFDAAYTHLLASQVRNDQTEIDTISVEAGTEIGFLYQRTMWRTPNQSVGWTSRPELNERSIALAEAAFQELSEMSQDELAEYLTRSYDDPLSQLNFLNPTSSDPRANWGRMDQFAFFLSDNATFLAMEDLHLAGVSDLSFQDANLWIDVRLIPVPEPGTLVLLTNALLFCVSRTGVKPRR